MLNKIIEFSVRNKLIIALFTLGLLVLGVVELRKLPIDAQPDITNNQVQVITVAPSYGAADIERLVTFPIEQSTSNISGITEIRSFSRFGLSLVTIVFNDDTDVYWARQQVSERLNSVKEMIPEGIGTPELGPISTGLGEIFQYVIKPKPGYENKYTATELRTIQDWTIRRQLLGTKGVAEVSSFGGKLKQYEIALDPSRLKSLKLSIQDIFDALDKNNQNTGGAYIEKKETVLFIRSEGLIENEKDIEKIAVSKTKDNTPILLKDVATIRIGHAIRYGAMTFNDQGEVSGAIILMLKGENANEVVKNIKTRLSEIEKSLPEGVEIEPFLDRAKMVSNTISTVKTNLVEGALIVVFILVIFLGNLRAGLLVASVIPLSMLFAIIMMNLFGVGGNLMSLGALDFGLIVDGAVIIVEAVLHQLIYNKRLPGSMLRQNEMDLQVTSSASKMVNSAVFGQIIILIVYLPIFSLEGIEGKMFKPMAQTVAFALVGAFILSLTYIPMMTSLVISKKKPTKKNFSDKVMEKLELGHQKLLIKALKWNKLIITVVLVLFTSAVVLLTRMGGEFVPSLEEGDFAVEMRILQGSSIDKTIEVTTKAAHILKTKFPEIEKIVTKIGSAEIPTEPMPMDAGDMIIVLKPKKLWTSATSFPELSAKMSAELKQIPGLTTGFQFPVQMRFNELMTGARQDVVCKIFGEDLDSLALYANALGAIINKVEGAQDLYIEPVVGAPQVVVEYDRDALARHGIQIETANRILNASFAGQHAGLIYEGEKRFDMVVKLRDDKRQNLEDIRNLLIPTGTEQQIPLHQLANVQLKSSPNQIQREDTKRRIIVGFNIRGRDVQTIVEELQAKVEQEMKMETGYTIAYGGTFENLNKAKAKLGVAVPVSLLLIFLLLYFAFRSFKQSLLIYTAIPLSAIGGIYFLVLRGMPFSISAGVGFIALFGVAVLNGIVLIAEFNRLKQHGIRNNTRIVMMGSRLRLRPVLMTAFVASLGFLPMALSSGAGAEVQRPLATVVIGGLLLATALTLFVLPILYVLIDRIKIPKMKRKYTIILFLLLSCGYVNAQTRINLKDAIKMATSNNLEIRQQELELDYRSKMKNTAVDIPQMEISTEWGQLQSSKMDNKVGFIQRFDFPTVYSRKKNVLDASYKQQESYQDWTKALVNKSVKELYYAILLLQERDAILAYSDSLYVSFVNKANLKFQLGDANIMETTVADLQREQITLQRKELKMELERVILQFQFVLQTKEPLLPQKESIKFEMREDQQSTLEQHPELQVFAQQIETNQAETKLESSKLLPTLNAGWYSQSMKEISGNRFNVVQFGIGLPLFTKGQRSLAKAAKVQEIVAQGNYDLKLKEYSNKKKQWQQQFASRKEVVQSFEQNQLNKATALLNTAMLQYNAGEINYLDWVILINQSLGIKSQYLNAIEKLNESTIELDYLSIN